MKLIFALALAASLAAVAASPVNDRRWSHPPRSEVEEFVRATMPSDRKIANDLVDYARDRKLLK